MSNRKFPPVVAFTVPLFFGLLGFYRATQSPRFESYRSMDVLQLLVAGACLGAALLGLTMMLFRRRR